MLTQFSHLTLLTKITPGKSLGEARLSETPYKHVVRHAVTGHHPSHSHLEEVRSVYVTEEVPPSGYVDNEIAV